MSPCVHGLYRPGPRGKVPNDLAISSRGGEGFQTLPNTAMS